jgi:hypothetical protein
MKNVGKKKKHNKAKKGKSAPDADDDDEEPKKKKKSDDEDDDDSDDSDDDDSDDSDDSDDDDDDSDDSDDDSDEDEDDKPKKKKKKSDDDDEDEDSDEDDEETDDEDEDEDEEEKGGKKSNLVRIDPESYTPRPPSSPIPPGVQDCFGKFRDPDVPECRQCLESDNCNTVMKAKKEEGGGTVKKAKKKAKKEREDRSEKESAPKSTGLSETLQSILNRSRYKKLGGELTQKAKKPLFFVSIAGKRFARIARANRDEGFVVRLLTRLKPAAIGMKSTDWKPAGKGKYEFKGNVKFLGKKLRIIFKKAKMKMKASEEEEE